MDESKLNNIKETLGQVTSNDILAGKAIEQMVEERQIDVGSSSSSDSRSPSQSPCRSPVAIETEKEEYGDKVEFEFLEVCTYVQMLIDHTNSYVCTYIHILLLYTYLLYGIHTYIPYY